MRDAYSVPRASDVGARGRLNLEQIDGMRQRQLDAVVTFEFELAKPDVVPGALLYSATPRSQLDATTVTEYRMISRPASRRCLDADCIKQDYYTRRVNVSKPLTRSTKAQREPCPEQTY